MVCMLAMVLASSNLTKPLHVFQSCFDHMFYFNVLFVHVLAIIKYICLSWWPLSAIKRLERVFLAKLGKGKGKAKAEKVFLAKAGKGKEKGKG